MPQVLLLGLMLFAGTAAARAQDDHDGPLLPVDPTPLDRLLSPAEKALVMDARNPKKNVEHYIKISESHLDSAMRAVKGGDAHAAERELDIYNKAMAEACKTAFSLQDGKRQISKKIEQSLYKQIRTLESIERLFPNERGPFAEAALKHAKRLRVQALNEAFAGGDVLKDPEAEKKEKHNSPDGGRASGAPRPLDTPALHSSYSPAGAVFRLAQRQALPVGARPAGPSRAAQRESSQIPGDYLTLEEDEHVREAQKADDRIKVFMKIADRRLAALKGDAPAPADAKAEKRIAQEAKDWGLLPKMGRADLLRQYARAIEECMAKLEDAYERNPKSAAIPKSLAALRDATQGHLETLRALAPEMKTDREIAAMRDAIDQAETANKGARDGLKGKEQ
ncbi:MAG: hypothetical protein ACLGJB_20360 [Blastocatellia bacterium]